MIFLDQSAMPLFAISTARIESAGSDSVSGIDGSIDQASSGSTGSRYRLAKPRNLAPPHRRNKLDFKWLKRPSVFFSWLVRAQNHVALKDLFQSPKLDHTRVLSWFEDLSQSAQMRIPTAMPLAPLFGHSQFVAKRRRGATAVEFAIVAPILFLVVFGLVEFSRYMMLRQIAITSTREGSRKATLGTTTSDTQVDTVVRDYLAAGGVQSSVANDPAKTVVSVSPSGLNGLASGTPITVNVQMSFADLSWVPGDFFGLASVNVSSSTTMNRE